MYAYVLIKEMRDLRLLGISINEVEKFRNSMYYRDELPKAIEYKGNVIEVKNEQEIYTKIVEDCKENEWYMFVTESRSLLAKKLDSKVMLAYGAEKKVKMDMERLSNMTKFDIINRYRLASAKTISDENSKETLAKIMDKLDIRANRNCTKDLMVAHVYRKVRSLNKNNI